MWLESGWVDDMAKSMMNHVSIPYKKGKISNFLNKVKAITN